MSNGKSASARSKRRNALITHTHTHMHMCERAVPELEMRVAYWRIQPIQPDVARVLLNSIDSFACTARSCMHVRWKRAEGPGFSDSLRRSVAGREQRLNNKFLSRPR